MEYRKLGPTGTQVSTLCLGAWRFGEATDEDEGIRLVHMALDHGINFVDTANVYQRGVSETIVGKALQGKRDDVVLATKVHGPMGEGLNQRGNSRRHIMQQVEASLRRLQTDWIDLYYLHRPDPLTPQEEELMALDDLIRQGKVRYAGSSHYPAWQLVRAKWIAADHNLHTFVVDQPGYNLLRRDIEQEVIPFAEAMDFGLVPHSPLAQGILTGKYAGGQPPSDARGVKRNPKLLEQAQQADPIVKKVMEIAEQVGKTPGQVAIRWVLQKPAVSSAIIGPRTTEQLQDNLGSVDWQLSDEQMEALDGAGD